MKLKEDWKLFLMGVKWRFYTWSANCEADGVWCLWHLKTIRIKNFRISLLRTQNLYWYLKTKHKNVHSHKDKTNHISMDDKVKGLNGEFISPSLLRGQWISKRISKKQDLKKIPIISIKVESYLLEDFAAANLRPDLSQTWPNQSWASVAFRGFSETCGGCLWRLPWDLTGLWRS